MYVSENLVQRPGSEFLAIGSSEEFMFLKDRGGAGPDLREAHRVGEVTSTHDGKGTTIEWINIAMAHFPKAHLLESDEHICAAVLGNRPINVRTRYTDPAEKTKVVMNYPVRCSNSASKQQRWQIDTGRVLALARGGGNGLLVERLAPAYIVFNQLDWAELAIMKMTMDGAPAAQYSDVRRLNVTNELFVLNREG